MKINILRVFGMVFCLALFWALILYYIVDNQSNLLLCFSLLPILLPNTFKIGLVMNENSKYLFPFKLAFLNDKNQNLSKEWYIEFWAWSASKNKLIRKRLTAINSIKTIKDRIIYGEKVIKEINEKLKQGYHFDKIKSEKLKAVQNIQSVKNSIGVIEFLKIALKQNENKYNGRTFKTKEYDILFFEKYVNKFQLNHLNINEFELIHCKNYQRFLLQQNYSGKTINCRIATISTFFNEALKDEIININQWAKLTRIKEVKTSINKAFTIEQINIIKNEISELYPGLWLACNLMFYCFLRPNEIRQLRVKHLDLKLKKIFVNSIISKNKKSFTIDIPSQLLELLAVYLSGENNPEFYLINCKFIPGLKMMGRNTLRDKYSLIIKPLKLDKDLTFYSFKHTGVVMAYQAGVNIKALQLQGRWHSIEQMDNYLKSLGLVENKEFTSIMNNFKL